ncbi:MAG: hypothetical protein AB9866_26460 [Syntrophobacteraceae bacterium]
MRLIEPAQRLSTGKDEANSALFKSVYAVFSRIEAQTYKILPSDLSGAI